MALQIVHLWFILMRITICYIVHRLRIGSTLDIDAINVLDVIALQGESRYRAASLIGTICR